MTAWGAVLFCNLERVTAVSFAHMDPLHAPRYNWLKVAAVEIPLANA
jgi:hypothetical protein